MLLQVLCLHLPLDGSIILSAGALKWEHLLIQKINVTKLPRLEKWDCSNYFLLKGYFHSAVEGGWVARNKTVVTVSQSTSQGTHFTGEATWAMIFLTWQRGAKAGAQAAWAVLCVTAILAVTDENAHNSNPHLQTHLTQPHLPLAGSNMASQEQRSSVAKGCAVGTAVWEQHSLEHPVPSPRDARHWAVAIYYVMHKSIQTQLDASCTLHLFSYLSTSREVNVSYRNSS